jgi:hypothetical protein
MPAVAFDTLKLAQRLEAAGFAALQAQQVASALADTIGESVVTREYLDLRLGELRSDVRIEIAGLRAELLKWAVGIGVAGVAAIGGMIVSASVALVHLLPHG